MSEWTPDEPEQIIREFSEMLRAATGDGAAKRRAGTKPSWKVDTSHEAAIFSHLTRWKRGELIDPDSGAHPLVHLAWRALAIAWRETQDSLRDDSPEVYLCRCEMCLMAEKGEW